MIDLMDQVVVVTGANGNLGTAVAQAAKAAGAKLVLIGRERGRLEEAFPDWTDDDGVLFVPVTDISSQEEAKAAVDEAARHFGRIDALVNTVGGFRSGDPLHETPFKTLELMMKLNTHTAWATMSAVLPLMIDQKSGKIVNIGAKPALEGKAKMSAYGASKGALLRLTESTSAEVRKHGINVNAILPGTIDTPENRKAMPKADTSKWVAPESLAAVILFLLSAAARDVHGAAIPVYGLS